MRATVEATAGARPESWAGRWGRPGRPDRASTPHSPWWWTAGSAPGPVRRTAAARRAYRGHFRGSGRRRAGRQRPHRRKTPS